MKIKSAIYNASVACLLLFSVMSCKKKETITIPTVKTTSATNIMETTVTAGGDVIADGGDPVTTRGVCWNNYQSPEITGKITTDGTGTGSYVSLITGLIPCSTYYIRAYATNSQGTVYGEELVFTVTCGGETGTVSDIEGNVYKTVKIGNQWWMAENLRVTKLNDGSAIPLVTDNTAWSRSMTSGYCWYNNNEAVKIKYGALYNRKTITNGKLSPDGWHVPTSSEWSILINYLGGRLEAGGKLREAGTMNWSAPNYGATNATGFTALPGGSRDINGTFGISGNSGYWWNSTDNDAVTLDGGWSGRIIGISHVDDSWGCSVRCVKD